MEQLRSVSCCQIPWCEHTFSWWTWIPFRMIWLIGKRISAFFYHEYFISLYHRQKNLMPFLFEHRTVIVLRLDQRSAKWRTFLLILGPHWIVVCRVRHVFLNISIYKYEYPMKLIVSVSVSHSNVISSTSIDFLRG